MTRKPHCSQCNSHRPLQRPSDICAACLNARRAKHNTPESWIFPRCMACNLDYDACGCKRCVLGRTSDACVCPKCLAVHAKVSEALGAPGRASAGKLANVARETPSDRDAFVRAVARAVFELPPKLLSEKTKVDWRTLHQWSRGNKLPGESERATVLWWISIAAMRNVMGKLRKACS